MNWQFWLRHRPLPLAEEGDNCTYVRPLLSLMSDGMASVKEVREAQSHLSTCADCRQAQVWMEATRQAIITRPVALPPADMRARIARAIAASAETALPAVPVGLPPARRAFALRPAYAAAASLSIAGAFLGHYLLTSGHGVGSVTPLPPAHIAASGQTGAAQPLHLSQPGQMPARSPHKHPAIVATLPHDAPGQPNPGQVSLAPSAPHDRLPRVSSAKGGKRGGDSVIATLPAHGVQTNLGSRPAPLSVPASGPRHSDLIASRPAPKLLGGMTAHGSVEPQLARVPTTSFPASFPAHAAPAPTLITPTPLPALAPATPTTIARLPEAPSAPSRAVPGDARISLASYRNTRPWAAYARRLSMANGVRQRPNYTLLPITYTPTSENEPASPRRAIGAASHPAGAQAAPTAASPAPEVTLTSSDQRRSERDKQWSDAAPTGGA